MQIRQENSQITQTVREIKDILQEVSANPDDFDLLKLAVEIYHEVLLSLRQLRAEQCFWCGQIITPTSHNFVHLGGHGEVVGCDDCLRLVK